MKVCSKCKVEKNLNEFTSNIKAKDGLNWKCKSCYSFDYHLKKLRKFPEISLKTCSKCKIEKSLDQFGYSSSGYLNVRCACKECRKIETEESKEKVKIRTNKNKDRIKEVGDQWLENNIDHVRERSRNYQRRKRQEDEYYKLRANIRNLLCRSFKRCLNGQHNKSQKTEDILGCTLLEFIMYIQSLFTEGMNLSNHGLCEECWHIDHKIPLASAKNEEELYILNHYTNLQPMWSRENIRKGKKLL